MSRPASCLKSLLSLNFRVSLVPSRPVIGTRQYAQSALKVRSDDCRTASRTRTPTRRSREERVEEEQAEEEDNFDSRGSWSKEVRCGTKFSDHLNGVFPGLQFPSELARRILTHASHQTATNGHNASLSFIGRRVLDSYLHLFLTSSSALTPEHDLEDIAYRTLHTYALGEHVGSKWGLGRNLRWVPAIAREVREQVKAQPDSPDLRKVGLYKVQGDAVTAVMGGIFFQFGGSVAHRVFHTRLLPCMLVKGALHEAFHRDALLACDRMGGPEGRLVINSSTKNVAESAH